MGIDSYGLMNGSIYICENEDMANLMDAMDALTDLPCPPIGQGCSCLPGGAMVQFHRQGGSAGAGPNEMPHRFVPKLKRIVSINVGTLLLLPESEPLPGLGIAPRRKTEGPKARWPLEGREIASSVGFFG
jgi:hypothetical protein